MHPPPFLERGFEQRVHDGDAGIVDQHVEAAMMVNDGADRRLPLRLIRDIKRHEDGITALFDDRIGNRTTGLRIDIRNDHARAMPGQRRCTGRTDTLRRTRHQRDLI